MSSFLEPDMDYLKNFHGFEEWSKILETVKVKTKKFVCSKLAYSVF